MAPSFLIDLSTIDLNRTIISLDEIRKVIPQRFEMEMLSGIVYDDGGTIIGYKDVTLDDFWVRGHIPGRPLMPGVMMIECAAQLCAFWTMLKQPEMGFVGFARCDRVSFRGTVVPPRPTLHDCADGGDQSPPRDRELPGDPQREPCFRSHRHRHGRMMSKRA